MLSFKKPKNAKGQEPQSDPSCQTETAKPENAKSTPGRSEKNREQLFDF